MMESDPGSPPPANTEVICVDDDPFLTPSAELKEGFDHVPKKYEVTFRTVMKPIYGHLIVPVALVDANRAAALEIVDDLHGRIEALINTQILDLLGKLEGATSDMLADLKALPAPKESS